MTGPGPFTPRYASPEQLRGEAITTASDVYSLGVLLYLALTGTWPYRPSSPWPSAILEHMSTHDPPPVSRAVLTEDSESLMPDAQRFGAEPLMVSRELKGDLDNIVAKAIEVDPDRRYRSVEQLDDDLRRYLEGAPVLARQGTALYRAGKFVRRHRAGVGAAVGFVGMSGSFALAMSRQAARVARERNAALEARDRAEQAQLVAEQSSRAEQEVSGVLVELFESEDPQNRDPNVSALSLVQKGVARVQEHTSLALPTRIKLLGTLGLVLRNLGEYPTSVEVLKQAASLGEGEWIPEKGEVYLNLGRVYESMADFERASTALDKAGELADPEDISTFTAILNLQGIVAYYRGNLSDAISFYRQAQELAEEALGPMHAASLIPRINVAGLESCQGRIEPAARDLFDILEAKNDLSLPVQVACLQTLAGVLTASCEVDVAVAAGRWALEGNRRLLGKSHKQYLRMLLINFHACCQYGRLQSAQDLLDSVDIDLIPDHLKPSVQTELRLSRGFLAFHRGQYANAVECLTSISETSELVSPLPLDRFGLQIAAAWSFAELGQIEEAEEWLGHLLLEMGDAFGEVSFEPLIHAVHGRIHEAKGALDAAEVSYQKASSLEPSAMILRGRTLGLASKRLCALLRARGREDLAIAEEKRRAESLSPRVPMDFPDWLFEEPNFEKSPDPSGP